MKVLNISICVGFKEEMWEGDEEDKQGPALNGHNTLYIIVFLSSTFCFVWIVKKNPSICQARPYETIQPPSPVSQSAWAKWPPQSASVWTSTCWAWTGFLIPAAADWWKPSWVSDISQASLPGTWLRGGNAWTKQQWKNVIPFSLDKNIMCILWSCCAEVNILSRQCPHCLDSFSLYLSPCQYSISQFIWGVRWYYFGRAINYTGPLS